MHEYACSHHITSHPPPPQLPNDPNLLDTLTVHKVDVTVMPQAGADSAGGVGAVAQSLIFPAVLFAGLFFLSRRGGDGGGEWSENWVFSCFVGKFAFYI